VAEKEELTKVQKERIIELTKELNRIQPGLIEDTKDYGTALDDVKGFLKSTNIELEKLTKLEREIAQIKVTVGIVNLRKDIRELKGELEDTSSWEKFKIAWQSLDDALGLFKGVDQYLQLEEATERMVLTEEGRAVVLERIRKISRGILENEVTIERLKAQAKEDNVKLGGEMDKLDKAYVENMEAANEEQQEILNVLVEQIGKSGRLVEMEAELLKLERQREALLRGIKEEMGPEEPPGLETEDPEDVKKRNDYLFNIKKARLAAELELLRLNSEDSLESMEIYAQKEFEFKKMMAEQERDWMLASDEKMLLDELDIKETYDQKILAAEKEKNEKIKEMRLQSIHEWARMISDGAEMVGEALGSMAGGVEDAWKPVLKAMIDMFADYYKAMLRFDVFMAMALGNIGKAALSTAAIAAISALQGLAKARIDKAAVGAEITKRGIVGVEPGEVIIPAGIVRKNREQYEKDIGVKTQQQLSLKDFLDKIEIPPVIIQYPMVSDRKFWDNVVEQYIVDSFNRVRRRIRQT
jgi:hypothetical protein